MPRSPLPGETPQVWKVAAGGDEKLLAFLAILEAVGWSRVRRVVAATTKLIGELVSMQSAAAAARHGSKLILASCPPVNRSRFAVDTLQACLPAEEIA